MLDAETKRRIDSCRDILVGKVPDPKSQVEQITIALIYKFMDDMDAEAEEFGGERTFFAGEFARYGWAKLMSPTLGGYDVLNLYSEAIQKMPANPGIPGLFRDIFKNAYLPYRDPETLRAFVKEINGFCYDHSERLGDAFEYLLSVLGSQGDAGQFRTPRHIIEFIVNVVAPQKHETILDPACGTAGFLISSYKHILRANTKDRPGDLLTPDERARLAEHLRGYDISPDMVRLSLVNLYLHGFPDPHIEEYDTLTSDEKWNEHADVILANPPFMSPKGGIRPHKRFGVQSNRSEVLFVDYIAEHLSPNGRAGIIVPEGVIFQSGTAYRQLREMLVKNYLVAVVSLPAGVFQPYSGVKTSVLIMDRKLAKTADSILFVKIESDGFGLGAQRRATEANGLPTAANYLKAWMESLRSQSSFVPQNARNLHAVLKCEIAATGDYNLSADRYFTTVAHTTEYELVELGNTDVFQIESGGTPLSTEESYWNGGIHWATLVDLPQKDYITQVTQTARTISAEGLKNSSAKLLPVNTVLVSTRATIGRVGIARVPLATNQGFKNISIKDTSRVLPEFVAYMVKRLVPQMEELATGGTFKEISKSALATLRIPLPPLDVQKEIVAEIEGYQQIIDGARQVVKNYKPRIVVSPDWPMLYLGGICENLDAKRVPITKSDREAGPYPYYGASGIVDYVADFIFDENLLLVSEDGANLLARTTPIAFSVSGKLWVNNHAHVLRFADKATQKYVEEYINSIPIENFVTGSAQPKLNQQALNSIKVPLPDLETQKAIVAEIEAEQKLVAGNRELIRLFEAKIKAVLARVWGE